jgi:hypothetical protein
MRTQLVRFGIAAAALAGAVAVAPAGAADKPVPCNGTYLVPDKAGDQNFDPSGQGLPGSKAPDNVDITGLFFNFTDGKLTANIEIAKLDKTLPSPTDAQGGIWYYVVYSYKQQAHFVRAANRSGGDIEYATGTIDGNGVYKTDATTVHGSFIEGEKGVISMEIPAASGGKEGETLGSAGATADYIQGADDQAGLNNHVDTAPDGFNVVTPNGKNFKVAPCGGPTGPTGPAGALPVTAAPKTIGKAKKAKKGKSISVKLTSTAPVANLKAKLKKASGKGATLATGKLASLDGKGRLKLKFKKTLKKGKYKLLVTGTVDGITQTAKLGVKLK